MNGLFKFFKNEEKNNLKPGGEKKKLQIAAAAILIEIAKSDSDFAPEELEVIKTSLRVKFNLTDEEIQTLILESERERENSSDLFQFTHQINKEFSKEEKFILMEMIWKVIYADGILDKHEDYLAHKFATLLRLNHEELITTKMKVKSQLNK